MFFADKLTLGTPRRTREGYLAVRAKAARAGIYDYLGREIDPEGKHFAADQVVKVYRPEDEVFAADSVHSFLLKPITDDHPAEPVTAADWAKKAKGVNAGAMRDGEYLAFDLVLMDADTIAKVEAGKRELSNGYQSQITIATDGKHPDGTACDAWQSAIRGNHVAIVKAGRAGHECRIGDVATCDAATVELLERLLDGQTYAETDVGDKNPKSNARREASGPGGGGNPTQDGEVKMPHVLIIDGLQVPNVSDEAKAAIEKLQGQVTAANDAKAKAETDLAKAVTDAAAKETKIADLLLQVEDAKVTPAMLREAGKTYQAVVDKATALGVKVEDDMDEAAIMKAAVTAQVGDASKDWNDEQIAISFATLKADAKADPLRKTIADGIKSNGNGATAVADARKAWLADKASAYRKPASQGVN